MCVCVCVFMYCIIFVTCISWKYSYFDTFYMSSHLKYALSSTFLLSMVYLPQ